MNSISINSYPIIAIFMGFFLTVYSDLAEIDNVSNVRPSGSKGAGGNLYGVRLCGGKGKFIQCVLEGCKTTDSICEYPADGERLKAEITFVPSQTADQLGIKVLASINGSEPMIVEDHPLENSKVIAGVEQTIDVFVRTSKEYKGSKVTAQLELYTVVEKLVEICTKADFILV